MKTLAEISDRTYDVAVIGGGINGCAAADLLTSEGYSVLVVDKGDFGSGATSRSGRILHCGLRHMSPDRSVWEYLVRPRSAWTKLMNARDMSRGQVELLETIPGRLRTVDLALPIYRGGGYSGWHVDVGARLIRFFNGDRVTLNYRRWRNPRSADNPLVQYLSNQAQIESVVGFRDYQFDWPERIAIDALLNAEERGATVRNYTAVTALDRREDGDWELQLADAAQGETAKARAKVVLNLAGIWLDEVAGKVRFKNSGTRRVVGVKGVHLLVRLHDRFAGYGIVGVNSEQEPYFCLPMGDLHYIGPTETLYDGNVDDVTADEEDVDFILAETGRLLPELGIGRADIVLSWAGVRPITYDAALPKGRRLPYGVIHDYGPEGSPNMLGVTWGIIVTHRDTARAILKEVGRRVSPSAGKVPISSYERSYPPSESPLLQAGFPYRIDDVTYAVLSEHARDLTGVLFNRLGIGWSGRLRRSTVERVVDVMASLLDWDDRETTRQVEAFERYLARSHRFRLV